MPRAITSKAIILQCLLPKYDLQNTPQSKPETALRDAEAAACSTKDVAGRELKPVVLASVESRTGSVNSCPGFTRVLINLPALLLPCFMSIYPTSWMIAGNGSFTQDTFPLALQIHGLCYLLWTCRYMDYVISPLVTAPKKVTGEISASFLKFPFLLL